jgi:hypothetical protein
MTLAPARPERSRGFRAAALVTLLTFLVSCHSWRAVPLTEYEEKRSEDAAERIRITPADGGAPFVVRVTRLDYPNVTGYAESEEGRTTDKVVTYDLTKTTKIEVWRLDGWNTAFLVGGIVLGALLVAALVVALTKTSCPFVYVDDGTGLRFVGEAYSGATSRATQRGDMLPLPPLGRTPSLVLSNEAWERQFTDLLEIVVVDHPGTSRALATPDAGIVLVGAPVDPRAAVDLEGADARGRLLSSDGDDWQTDLAAAARQAVPPTREGLVLSFPGPGGGVPVALEVDGGNTPWLDVVFGRFFALLGDRLTAYQDDTDRPESAAASLAWREREGVDLLVEVEREGAWRRVTVVPTVGPASRRHFAVPLGALPPGEVRIRLSGGVGFWRFDRVALAPVVPGPLASSRHAPTSASPARAEVRSQLARADGDYQVLEDRGDRIKLSFDLPAPAAGLERDAFLHTSGYYRVNRPPQASLSVGTLLQLRDEPGSLSRFSIDLYRGYERLAAAGPGPTP